MELAGQNTALSVLYICPVNSIPFLIHIRKNASAAVYFLNHLHIMNYILNMPDK
jgi:hypothetical protein